MAIIKRRCKNKDCRKILPDGYKHKYCEACMNKKAHNTRNILGATLGLCLFIITLGKFGGKK